MAIWISHSEAVDLAIDQLDWPLSDIEKEALDGHVESCEDCREEIEWIKLDDELIETGIEWQDEFGSGGDEFDFTKKDDSTVFDPDEDQEIEGKRSLDDEDEPPLRGGNVSVEEGDEFSDALDDELDEDDDLHASGVEDETTFGGDGSETNDELDKMAEELGKAGEASQAPGSSAEGDEGDDSEAEAAAAAQAAADKAQAEAEADAMSDEDLGSVDQDKQEDDGAYPDCAADGVESAAQANGARMSDSRRKDAERSIRDDEGVEKTEYGKVAVYKSTSGILQKRGWNAKPETSGYAAAAIRNAILRSRTGTTGTERYQKRGKLDGKSLHRIAMQDTRLFKRNTAPDPGKYVVWVMVDVSGSMGGTPVADAASVARALADATMGTPTVRLEIWAWSDPFMRRHAWEVGCRAGVVRVWNRHMPTTEVFKLADLPMGGTPDSPVLDWAWRAINRETRQGEQPVIIMCSDGWGDYNMPQAIDRARKHGVLVKSVALGNLNEAQQEQRFGRGNYVPWQGSITATARPLADLILRMVTGKGERS